MAKKVETVSLIDTFSEFKELKNIDRTTMVSVLEEMSVLYVSFYILYYARNLSLQNIQKAINMYYPLF